MMLKKKDSSKRKEFTHKKKQQRDDNVDQFLEYRQIKLASLKVDEISKFSDLPISKKTLIGLSDEKFTEPTKIQRQTLAHSLSGVDVVAEAKTGSGKTLAFIIPLLERLYCQRWSQVDGLGALVITPTRELAYQILEVINKVGRHHNFSVGLIIGGKDLKYEWSRIGMCNIMICTPGRFLQHMTENPNFKWENLQVLVLDEADQCLSLGFADTMNIILDQLPRERQTLLFSATQTRDVKDLIRAGCQEPIYCSAHEHSKTTTPKSLKESYVICDDQDKVTFLYSFLRNHLKHKILIFLSTCKQVKYLFDIFCKLQPGLSVMGLHGDMHQLRRMAVYDEFCRKKHAILFATDVAARGLDIPNIDWVVQADCPEDVTTYIHRAGRTARHIQGGEALLLLTSSQEEAMASNLRTKNIPIEKIDVDPSKLQDVSLKMEFILTKYDNLREEAVRAFKAYLKYFSLMKDKRVFDVTSIDMNSYAKSLGLKETPRVRFIERKLKNSKANSKNPEVSQSILESSIENETVLEETSDEEDTIFDYLPGDAADYEAIPLMKDKLKQEVREKDAPLGEESKTTALKVALGISNRIIFDSEEDDHHSCHSQSESKGSDPKDAPPPEEQAEPLFGAIAEGIKSQDISDKEYHKGKLKERRRKERLKEKKASLNKREEKRKAASGEREDDIDEESYAEDSDYDAFTQALIDDLPDPDRLYGGQPHEGDRESPPRTPTGEEERRQEAPIEPNPSKKESGIKRSADEDGGGKAKKKKRAGLREYRDDISSLGIGDKEELALFLLKNKR